jgi:hypothetical protein
MVFLALPALQRAQRDTQRKEDISRFMTAVTHYEANNRGAIPDFNPSSTGEGPTLNPTGGVGCHVEANGAPSNPNSFCGRYLIVQGANDQFADPDGNPYQIKAANARPENSAGGNFIVSSNAADNTNGGFNASFLGDQWLTPTSVNGVAGVTIKNVCNTTNGCGNTADASIGFSGGVQSTDHGGYSAYGYAIHVIYSATCNGEVAIKSSGARKFAVLYKLEGGGVMCQSN